MLTLQIQNKILHLLSGQKVSFDINNLIFDTEFLNGNRSSSFKIAVDADSQTVFGSPEAMVSKSKTYTFEEFDAALSFNGIKLYAGKFRLRKATLNFYEGNFVFGISDLVSQMSKPIAEVLGNESYVFETTDLAAEMKKTVTTADSPILFPVIKLGNRIYNTYKNGNYLLPKTLGGNGYPVPMLRLMSMFNLIIKQLGYEINESWADAAYWVDVKKLILFNNKVMPLQEQQITETLEHVDDNGNVYYTQNVTLQVTTEINQNLIYAGFIPDMTVSEWLKSVKNLLCLYYEIDSNKKTFKVHFIKDILESSEVVDFTHKVSPEHEVNGVALQETNLKFGFDNWKDDPYFSFVENPWENTDLLNIKDDVETAFDLPATGTENDEIRLVRNSGLYWQCKKPINSSLGIWQEKKYQFPYHDITIKTSKKTSARTVSTKFAPVAANRLWSYRNEQGEFDKFIELPVATLLLKITNSKQIYAIGSHFLFKDSKFYPNQTPITVASDTETETKLLFPFSEKETIAYTKIVNGNFSIPDTGIQPVFNYYAAKPSPRILLYHGLQSSLVPLFYEYNAPPPTAPNVDTDYTYPMASPDGYNNFGAKISSFALRWQGKNGLVKKFWNEYIQNQSLSREFEVAAVLTLEDLRRFKPTQKIRIRESVFLVNKIETKIGDEVGFSRLSLVKIGSEIFDKPPLPPFGNLQLICTDTCSTSPNQNYFIVNQAQEVVTTLVCGQLISNLPVGVYVVRGSVENMLINGTATVVAGQTVTVSLGGCPVPPPPPPPPPPPVVKFVYQIGNFGLTQQFITDIFQDNANIGVTSREFVKTIAGVETVVFLGEPMPSTNYLLRSSYVWNNGLVTIRRTVAKDLRSLLVIADNGFSSVDGNLQINIRFGSFYTGDAANVRYSVRMGYENASSDNFSVPVPSSGNLTFIDVVRTLPQFGRTTFDVIAETLEDGVWTETNYVRSFVRIYI